MHLFLAPFPWTAPAPRPSSALPNCISLLISTVFLGFCQLYFLSFSRPMPAAVDSIDQQVALMKLAARTIAALQQGKSKKVPKLVKRALLGYSHQIGKLLTINCKGSSTNFKRELYWAMLTSASENWCQQLNQKTGRCLKQQHILRQKWANMSANK